MYVGLKQNPSTNRQDAIINWGNENVTPNGPDRLRIVFTTTAGVSGNSGSTAGLEMMQFASDPSGNETRIGVGSFDLLPYNIPQNTMHINSPDPNATTTAGGQSGLRFEDLNTSSTTIPNPGQGVLSVNANGDVVYVTAPNGIGNYCSQPQNPLTGNYEVPMNDFNIYYSGQGTPTTNAIGIGVPCGTAMPGKLTVYQDDANPVSVNTTSGVFLNSDNNLTFNLIIFRGVRGVANGENNVNEKSTNIGGDFRAESAGENIAVQGNVSGTTYLAARSFGGKFFASGLSQVNYGVYGSAFNGNSANYGVYGEAPQTTSSYAGYFAGNLLYTGSFGPSDQNLKTNIQSLTSADSILNLLNPVTFDYLQSGNAARLNLPTAQQMGLIAQEVETVLPNLVKEATHPAEYDTLGNVIAPSFTYKVLDYEKIIPVLLAGHKEQSNTIKTQDSILQNMQAAIQSQDSINQSLQQQINTLYNMITACCNANSAMGSNTQQTQNANQNSINVELKDVPSVILDQNVPNPFAEQTTITYTLPEGVHRAQILFYNAEGKLINTVDLSNQSGKGQINVFANDLSNGVYTYTLVVDGKIIDTKRMVKQK
jgi:hypothetical protein